MDFHCSGWLSNCRETCTEIKGHACHFVTDCRVSVGLVRYLQAAVIENYHAAVSKYYLTRFPSMRRDSSPTSSSLSFCSFLRRLHSPSLSSLTLASRARRHRHTHTRLMKMMNNFEGIFNLIMNAALIKKKNPNQIIFPKCVFHATLLKSVTSNLGVCRLVSVSHYNTRGFFGK